MAKATTAYAFGIAGVGLRKIARFHPGRCSSIALSPRPLPLLSKSGAYPIYSPQKGHVIPQSHFPPRQPVKFFTHIIRKTTPPEFYPSPKRSLTNAKNLEKELEKQGIKGQGFASACLYKQEICLSVIENSLEAAVLPHFLIMSKILCFNPIDAACNFCSLRF